MKKLFLIALVCLCLGVCSEASLDEDISNELGIENAKESIPESLEDDTGIEFSPTGTPTENGMSVSSVFKVLLLYVFDSVKTEAPFIVVMIILLILSSVVYSVAESSSGAMIPSVVRFAVSGVISTVLVSHVQNAFSSAERFVDELEIFITGMLPFMGSISVAGGGFSSAAVQKASLMTAIALLQRVIGEVTVPICSVVLAFAIAGYVSSMSLGTVADLISGVAVKTMSMCCGVMCAVLYFQNTVTSVTDSLGLRSVKLAAGNFIPIVGSFVSEASSTLISGVRLVRSTFGVFAICVLVYLMLKPIMNFFIIKLSLSFVGSVASLIGCTRESKAIKEISSVYNVLSATMIASSCFFIFAIAVFIKSEVG